ncbi:MAG: hypothetical protein ACKV2T_21760 [Kofleriaceae bacterium]
MRTWIAVLAACSLVGCGDDGGMMMQPDAPIMLRYPISFEVRGDVPLLVAVRDAQGVWTPVTANTGKMYMVQTTSRHAIATVCGSAVSGYRTNVELRTRFDDEPFLFCVSGDETPPQTFAITGQMMQAGEVHMSDTDRDTVAPWTFALDVSAGMHDLVAFGNSEVLLRRDIAVTAAAALPAIDLTQDGATYRTSVVLLTNSMPDETIQTVATTFTGNSIADYVRMGSTVYELPAGLIDTTSDFQFAEISAVTPTTQRTSPVETGGAAPMITLMPRLAGIAFTDTGASWSSLPDSTAQIRVLAISGNDTSSVVATGDFIAADTEISVSLDIPGFDDAWRVIGATQKTFTAFDDEFAQTSVSTAPPTAREHDEHERERRAALVRDGAARFLRQR